MIYYSVLGAKAGESTLKEDGLQIKWVNRLGWRRYFPGHLNNILETLEAVRAKVVAALFPWCLRYQILGNRANYYVFCVVTSTACADYCPKGVGPKIRRGETERDGACPWAPSPPGGRILPPAKHVLIGISYSASSCRLGAMGDLGRHRLSRTCPGLMDGGSVDFEELESTKLLWPWIPTLRLQPFEPFRG